MRDWMKAGSLALAFGVSTAALSAAEAAGYGQVVEYKQDVPIAYPDFTLVYKGTEVKGVGGTFKPGFRFENFTVTTASGTQTVSWSSGTGVIVDQAFEVAAIASAKGA